MKFKVGDTVKTPRGIGKILYADKSLEPYLVGIHGFHGHNGNGWVDKETSIQAGYKDECGWFRKCELEPVEDDTEIVISKHGKEVRTVFKVNGKIVKESVAKCHPDDRFNFKTGAEIAFSRLFEKKKKRITMREKLKQDHPDFVTKNSMGGCIGCPASYGYSNMNFLICGPHNEETCRKCWDREYIPKEEKK